MRILILSQYYPPEVGATQTRAHEFAKFLKSKNFDVTVIAESPNHPEGKVYPGYRNKFPAEKDQLESITIYRSWVYTKPKKSSLERMLFYLSYFFSTLITAIKIRHDYDLIWSTSPPLPVGMVAWVISKITGTPYILDVRDIWPAAAKALGELSNPILYRIFEKVEYYLYKDALKNTTVTRSFCDHINNKSGRSDTIFMANGTVPELFHPINNNANNSLDNLDINSNDFVITFAGLHGLAQGLDVVLDSAKHVNDINVKYLFIGDGPLKKHLVNRVQAENIENVLFHRKVPINEINDYLNLSDVLLVTLNDDEIFRQFIPSKLFDYMAVGKPIILNVPGDALEILNEANCGIFVNPGDPSEIAKAIIYLKNNQNFAKTLGENGRKFVMKNFTRQKQYKKILKILYTYEIG